MILSPSLKTPGACTLQSEQQIISAVTMTSLPDRSVACGEHEVMSELQGTDYLEMNIERWN